jgi:hypothetical protein
MDRENKRKGDGLCLFTIITNTNQQQERVNIILNLIEDVQWNTVSLNG